MEVPEIFVKKLYALCDDEETKYDLFSAKTIKQIGKNDINDQLLLELIKIGEEKYCSTDCLNQTILWCFAYGGKLRENTLNILVKHFKSHKTKKQIYLVDVEDYTKKMFLENFVRNFNERSQKNVWKAFYKGVLESILPINKHIILSSMAYAAGEENDFFSSIFIKPLNIVHFAARDTVVKSLIINNKVLELRNFIVNNQPWVVGNTDYVESWKALAKNKMYADSLVKILDDSFGV